MNASCHLCLDTGLTFDSTETGGRPRVCPVCLLGQYRECLLCGYAIAECRRRRTEGVA